MWSVFRHGWQRAPPRQARFGKAERPQAPLQNVRIPFTSASFILMTRERRVLLAAAKTLPPASPKGADGSAARRYFRSAIRRSAANTPCAEQVSASIQCSASAMSQR